MLRRIAICAHAACGTQRLSAHTTLDRNLAECPVKRNTGVSFSTLRDAYSWFGFKIERSEASDFVELGDCVR